MSAAQEPVAWMARNRKEVYYHEQGINFYIEDAIPLYTHPAPSWQGLSDDEIRELALDNDVISVISQVEQALKEKNHG